MNRKILKIFYFIGLLMKVDWFKILKLYKKNSENILWVYQRAPGGLRAYFFDNTFLNDLALVQSFVKSNTNFNLRIGLNIGNTSGKNIFYTISKDFNVFGLPNHSASLIHVVKELQKQNNTLFPSLNELLYWENKSYMHRKFDELNINCPKTWIVEKPEDIEFIKADLVFPCLLKECNSSGAAGVFEVKDYISLFNLINKKNQEGKYEFLVQLLINMRKDLRVIIVGEEIVLHYWRINESLEWKPTSTGHGSKVDFITFPNKWREKIVYVLKSLELRTGAFDITWQNDDLDTEPIFLEVSPSYMPNPSIPEKWKDIPYSEFKNKLSFKNSYQNEYINIVFKIKQKLVKVYLNKFDN
jgi:hypothetical protein